MRKGVRQEPLVSIGKQLPNSEHMWFKSFPYTSIFHSISYCFHFSRCQYLDRNCHHHQRRRPRRHLLLGERRTPRSPHNPRKPTNPKTHRARTAAGLALLSCCTVVCPLAHDRCHRCSPFDQLYRKRSPRYVGRRCNQLRLLDSPPRTAVLCWPTLELHAAVCAPGGGERDIDKGGGGRGWSAVCRVSSA